MATLKRYALAIFFLLVISFVMLLGTMVVKSFGDKMFENTGIKIEPIREENR
ncbi:MULTISPECIES: hypothetical protein [unclassified Sulfurimonas]|uniref:hypothetical protein n=1 Tax=unclassified Sulfurimonas TaxID=2623549 RepID=UPI0025D82E2C|nr:MULTISPECIES: hypothetical protein [unclassified Sulfurimonas]